MPLPSENITQLLVKWSQGDQAALEEVTAHVYAELRRLAASYLRHQRPDHTLQATALVHEAYIQLLDMQHIGWKNRAHFIGVAAQMMRFILVDHARQRAAQKRGGGEINLPLSRAERVAANEKDINLVALDEALQEFAVDYPRQAQVVELRFFGGLNPEEVAEVQRGDGIETSARTVGRDWHFAKVWLLKELNKEEAPAIR